MSDSKSGYFPSLDGLRAVSIAMVVCSHALGQSNISGLQVFAPFFDGLLGVRIFFVISGFLITTMLVSEMEHTGSVSLVNFYQRRALRLVPVQVSYVLFLIVLTKLTQLNVSSCRVITILTYTKNYFCAHRLDGHFWSLSVEEQFYLIWPACIVMLPRKWWFYISILFVFLAPISRAVQYHGGNHNWWWLTSNADALMLGCLTALLIDSGWMIRLVSFHPTAGRISAIVAMAVPTFLVEHLMLGVFTVTLGPMIQALAAAYLLSSLVIVRGGVLFRILNSKVAKFIGKISYSLYIWQEFFMFARPEDFGVSRLYVTTFPLNVVLTFAISILSYCSLEWPLAALRRSLSENAWRGAKKYLASEAVKPT